LDWVDWFELAFAKLISGKQSKNALIASSPSWLRLLLPIIIGIAMAWFCDLMQELMQETA